MNILLVYPEFPDTFWSFKHALKFIHKKAGTPPLGLLTVAALLPTDWEKRLVDLNVTLLTQADLTWADYVFISGMVVQRDKPVRVWGWGDQGDAIAVGFNGQTKTATVGDDGKWLLALDPMPANAKPQAMTVKGRKESLTFDNVLVGDVWLCSGQSNMESAAGGIVNSDLDMPLANIPTIRCLTLPLRSSATPLDNFLIEERNPFYVELKGVWRVSTPETAKDSPAVGYHFARIVTAITGVPI